MSENGSKNTGLKIIMVLALVAAAYFFLPLESLRSGSGSIVSSFGNRLGGDRESEEPEESAEEEEIEEEVVSGPESVEGSPPPEPEEPPETAEMYRRRSIGIQSFSAGGLVDTGLHTGEALPGTDTEVSEPDRRGSAEER